MEYEFKSIGIEVILMESSIKNPLQFGYLCDDAKKVKQSISVQMFGVLLGTIACGTLSDMFGRLRVGLFH